MNSDEQKKDAENGQNGSDHEDGSLEKLAAQESKEYAASNEESTPEVFVFAEEGPESIQVEAGTHLRGSERGLVITATTSSDELQIRRRVLRVGATDKADSEAAAIVWVAVL